MNWQEVCEQRNLQNLPFKIELNKRGQIIMSPAKVYHSAYQGEIEYFLRSLLKQGKTLPECAIFTRDGTKVADVVWVSKKRFSIIKKKRNVLLRQKSVLKCYLAVILKMRWWKNVSFILNKRRKKFGFVAKKAK